MHNRQLTAPLYVVKADDLLALNYLADDHPVPVRVEWINRANDRILSQSSLEQLLRTFHTTDASPSVAQLRETSGLRLAFASETARGDFARSFAIACAIERGEREYRATAIFPAWEQAESALALLVEAGVPPECLSLLSRANRLVDGEAVREPGYRPRTVLATVTGGGVAGAALGVAILVIPGLGPVAAAGAVLASTYSAVATASGIIGATGAAMATMLTDKDVDTYAENLHERQLLRGRTFLAVDTRHAALSTSRIRRLLEQNGGRCID